MKEATSKRRNVLSPSIRLIDVVSAWLTIQAALSCKVVEHADIRLKPGHARRTCHRLSVCPSFLLACVLSLFTSLHFTSQGKGRQVVDPRQGAPFPDSAVEEALGSAKVGAFPHPRAL